MNLWKNYKDALHQSISLHNGVNSCWATWESKGTSLLAKTYTNKHIIKSREVEIWNEKSCIYNNIIYPKTGSNLPCFGMDLMGFSDKKVIIVFDFQHPLENYEFSVPGLPVYEGDYRFFEIGNHFSKNRQDLPMKTPKRANKLEGFKDKELMGIPWMPVSYTHLTLPTKA